MIADLLGHIGSKDERLVAGFMCGTSTDGIDVALTRLKGGGAGTQVEFVGHSSVPFDPEFRQRLLNLLAPGTPTASEITHLSYETADIYTQALVNLVRELDINLSEVDLIGHHGVVLHHADGMYAEICEPSVIAEQTGITVISDFRARDCAAGGQGAPLSPYVDWILFNDPVMSRAVQNIGGIGNVCAMPPSATVDDLIGFDTGPGNRIIDQLVWIITEGKQAFDADGKIAQSGRVREPLLQALMEHPFIARGLPKCAGRGEFSRSFTADLLRDARTAGIADEDTVATATAFSTYAISDSYRRFITPHYALDEVIVGGGGLKNPTLMASLRDLLAPIPIHTHEDFGIPGDAREALSWAILANEALLSHPANVPQVTGARRPVVLGKITPGTSQ
jgi:anhydro-N-acetylmuramic acid kinase